MADAFIANAPSCAHALQRAFTLYADEPFLGTGTTNQKGQRTYSYQTYQQVGDSASRLASAMAEWLGLARGAHIGLCSDNRAEWLIADFAATFDAFVSVGIHTSWPVDEVASIMAEANIEAVVCSYDQAAKFVQVASERAASSGSSSSRRPGSGPGAAFGLNQMMAASGINQMMAAGGSGGSRFGGQPAGSDHLSSRSRNAARSAAGSDAAPQLPAFKYLIVMGYARAKAEAAATGTPLFGGASVPPSLAVFDFDLLAGPGLHSSPNYVLRTHTGLSTAVAVDASSGSVVAHDPAAPATIMYSSGTSGKPKGIVVSSARWKNDALHGGIAQCTDKIAISYMPLAHGADRGVCWQTCMAGGSIAFARPDHADLLEDMQAVHPRFMLGMSHFWNRVHADYMDDLVARVLADPHFAQALDAAVASSGAPRPDLEPDAPLVRSLVDVAVKETRWGAAHLVRARAALRDSLGSELIFVVTGGAHTSAPVLDMMAYTMVPGNEERVHDAYGTTEFPGISVNGVISSDIDLRLIDVPEMGYSSTDLPFPRGEIIVRCKDASVMTTEYFQNPDETRNAFIDGWYHTGDVGELQYTPGEQEPKLKIIDRRKNVVELYVSGRSVWVPAASLEDSVYSATPGISRMALCADRNADRLIAVVVPTPALADAASDPELLYSLLASFEGVAAAAGLPLEHIPADVIIDRESWSVGNGCLSVLGKVRRAAVQTRHKEALDRAYAVLETVSEDERLRARQERAAWRAASAHSTPRKGSLASGGPAFADNDASDATAAAAAAAGEAAPSTPVAAERKAAAALGTAFGDALRAQGGNEPGSIPASVPASNGSDRHQAWMYDFAFADPESRCEDPEGLHTMNSLLAVLRNAASIIAHRTPKWNAQAVSRLEAASAQLKTVERETRTAVAKAAVALAPYADSLAPLAAKLAKSASLDANDVTPAASLDAGAGALTAALAARKIRISVATFHIKQAKGLSIPEKEERWRQFRAACASLLDAGKCYGFDVPFWLTSFPGWIFPPAEASDSAAAGESETPQAPAMVFGSASVWCTGCGLLVEETVGDWGTFRAVSLDSDANYCAYCWKLFPNICDGLRASDAPATADAFVEAVFPDAGAAFAFDAAHPAHLRHEVFPADLSSVTPAQLITSAAKVFGTRLAVGVADPAATRAAAPLTPLGLALADAGKLVSHQGYLWITQGTLFELAAGLALKLVSWGAAGTFVGISGPNAFEVAICDLACALAGAGSFGIHTTYMTDEASAVIANAAPSVLLLSDQVLHAADVCENAGWSVEALLESPRDADVLAPVIVALEAPAGGRDADNELQAKRSGLSLVTLMDVLSEVLGTLASGNVRGPEGFAEELPDPRLARGVPYSDEHIFTLLYTSGSSGTPKGVMVTPRSFVADLSEPSSSWPLITVSYIPLSHSSDRMKMWEFLVKGGRVGFASYGASNWRAHETSKKDGVLSSEGSTNNVEDLFEQVKLIAPSAMSCPPRIWNGLYTLWSGLANASGDTAQADAYIRSLLGSRIKFLATGGAPTAPHVVEWIKSVFPSISFVDSYGTTEAGGITSNGYVLKSKGVQVKLDPMPDVFPGVRDGSVGELMVKTPNLNLGYYGVGEFGSGWYPTGDVATYDSVRGTYAIMERVSALRKSGSALVALGGLETLYASLPDVDDVFIDFVDDSGELVAFVSPKDLAAAADPALPGILSRAFFDAAQAAGLGESHVPSRIIVVDSRFDRESGLLGGSLKKNRGRFRQRFAHMLSSSGSGSGSPSGSGLLGSGAPSPSPSTSPDGSGKAGRDSSKPATNDGSGSSAGSAGSSLPIVPVLGAVGLVVLGAGLGVLLMRQFTATAPRR